MLECFPAAVIVGAVLGTLSGLGIGGGSLLLLWLTLVLQMDPQTARGINLLFFLPAAGVSCYLRGKQGAVDLKRILPAILAGCAAAAGFTWIGRRLPLALMKKLFGCLLLLTGLRELWWKPRKT